MSRTREITPVELWAPDYYKTKPEDLLERELATSARSLAVARFAGHNIFGSLMFRDPKGILQELGTGPYVRVANHLDFTDPLALGMVNDALGLPLTRYATMAELFSADHPQVANFIASLGGFPVDRARMENGDRTVALHFLKLAQYLLNNLAEPIDIFPEGGITNKPRNYSNKVGPIKESPLIICKKTKKPLVVAGIGGTRFAALRALNPLKPVRAAVCISKIYDYDELPTPIQLRMDMQNAANIAQGLANG